MFNRTQQLNATNARQGERGKSMLKVLLFSLSLAALAGVIYFIVIAV